MIETLPTSLLESVNGSAITRWFLEHRGDFDAALPSRRKPPAIFLCFTNRSGSTAIAAEASRWGYCGKPNHKRNFEYFNANVVIQLSKSLSINTFGQYIDHLIDHHLSPTGVFFSKVSIEQLAWLFRIGVLRKSFPQCTVIEVARRNKVAQAISLLIAEQTGEWSSTHPRSNVEPAYDENRLGTILRYISQANSEAEIFFDLTEIKAHRLIYEEFICKPAEIGLLLSGLCGVPPVPQASRTLHVEPQSNDRSLEWEKRFREQAKAALGSSLEGRLAGQ